MATGNYDNPWVVETFTPTIETANGFGIKSWGWVKGVKIGRIAIVSAQGIYNENVISSDKIALTIPYKSVSEVNAVALYNSENIAYVSSRPNGNQTNIYMSFVTSTNQPYYFGIVIPLA